MRPKRASYLDVVLERLRDAEPEQLEPLLARLPELFATPVAPSAEAASESLSTASSPQAELARTPPSPAPTSSAPAAPVPEFQATEPGTPQAAAAPIAMGRVWALRGFMGPAAGDGVHRHLSLRRAVCSLAQYGVPLNPGHTDEAYPRQLSAATAYLESESDGDTGSALAGRPGAGRTVGPSYLA